MGTLLTPNGTHKEKFSHIGRKKCNFLSFGYISGTIQARDLRFGGLVNKSLGYLDIKAWSSSGSITPYFGCYTVFTVTFEQSKISTNGLQFSNPLGVENSNLGARQKVSGQIEIFQISHRQDVVSVDFCFSDFPACFSI